MKSLLVLSILILTVLFTPCLGQDSGQKYYDYNVSGIVTNENAKPMADRLVCMFPLDRPFGGRIPCVKTDKEAKYSVTTNSVPGNYEVIVTDTHGDTYLTCPTCRSVGSGPLAFGAGDEKKQADLKFKPKE